MAQLNEAKSTIERRWPGLWSTLQKARNKTSRSIEPTLDTPEQTLVIDGYHLTSAYNRIGEARLQAMTIPDDATECWVYGLALGDLPRVLLERPHLQEIHVILMSPEVAYESFTRFDQMDWLDDPRISLELGSAQSPTVQKPYSVSPAELKVAEDGAVKLRDEIQLHLAAPFQFQHHQRLVQTMTTRARTNRRFFATDGDVATLFGSRQNKKIAVIAGGPTLSDWYPWLEAHRDTITIVAVSSALVPLQRAGLDPDAVVVIEYKEAAIRYFDEMDDARLTQTPLVYAPVVDPKLLERWPGPRLTAYLLGRSYAVPDEEYPKGKLFTSGTVTHTAVDLAVKMGAAEVLLFGADFCYPRETTHVAGAAFCKAVNVSRRRTAWVLDGHGKRAPSETNFIGYLRDLETYIGHHPEVRFLKGGRAGAAIEGVEWLDETRAEHDESA